MVTVYLKTPLFIFKSAPHLPPATAAVRGSEARREGGGVQLVVEQYLDEDGRVLDGSPLELFVPNAKIDHVVYG